jgi:hypothetical protein
MALIFKQDRAPQVVIDTLLDMGWTEFDKKVHTEECWNLFWKPSRPTMGEYRACREY